jgi:hypothetical protein
MARRIVVMSNCQTGGLYAALGAMLPDDEILPIAWLGVEPPGLRELLATADVWVTSLPRAESEALLAEVGGTALVVPVPVIWFPGFHPDLIHVPLAAGGELESAAGPYNSAIVLWGWLHGLTEQEILAAFTPATFAALGYHAGWATAVEHLKGAVEAAETDFGAWFLPLARGSAFMLTDNHPRVDALVQLARLVALRLGADADLVRFGWEQVIPDGLLNTSVVWPVYPGVADVLGLPGAFVWRGPDGGILHLPQFVRRTLDGYASIDPSTVHVPRFEHDPRFAEVLGASAGVGAGAGAGVGQGGR